jgi:hypothetical protein
MHIARKASWDRTPLTAPRNVKPRPRLSGTHANYHNALHYAIFSDLSLWTIYSALSSKISSSMTKFHNRIKHAVKIVLFELWPFHIPDEKFLKCTISFLTRGNAIRPKTSNTETSAWNQRLWQRGCVLFLNPILHNVQPSSGAHQAPYIMGAGGGGGGGGG